MFEKIPEKNYKNICFILAGSTGSLANIKETRPEVLDKMIREKSKPGEEQDMYEASLCAQKMAIYYGVPGLIHYINLEIKVIQELLEQGEIVGAQSFNTLCYLHLAKCIFDVEGQVSKLTSELLPEENITAKDYWEKKIAVLNELGDLESKLDEAARVGHGMFVPKELPDERRLSLRK